MKRDKVYQLLIDYAEGTIDQSLKPAIEAELNKSAALRDELVLLRNAFAQLQHYEANDAPSHYFTTFLPRLRERIESQSRWKRFVIPLWVEKIAAPATALFVLAFIAGLYSVFLPNDTKSVIDSVVRQSEAEEVERLMAVDAPFSFTSNIVSTPIVVNDNIIIRELLTSLSLYDNVVNDTQILAQLDEQDIEQIVQQLDAASRY